MPKPRGLAEPLDSRRDRIARLLAIAAVRGVMHADRSTLPPPEGDKAPESPAPEPDPQPPGDLPGVQVGGRNTE